MIDTTKARPFNQVWPVKIKITAKLIALGLAWESGRDIWRPLLAWQCRRESICRRRAKVFYTGRRPATVQRVALEWSLQLGRQGNPSKDSLDLPVARGSHCVRGGHGRESTSSVAAAGAALDVAGHLFTQARVPCATCYTPRKGQEKTRKNSLIAIAVLLNSVTPRLRLQERPTD